MASGEVARKDKGTFLSLPERPVEQAPGRFPGLGFLLLAAPSRQPEADSGLIAAFVAITVAGPPRVCTGVPCHLEPRTDRDNNYNVIKNLSRTFFEISFGGYRDAKSTRLNASLSSMSAPRLS